MIGVAAPEYDPAAPQSATTLPVGTPATVRSYVRELLRRHRAAFAVLIGVNAVAVIASMVGPYLLGGVVEDLSTGVRDLHLARVAALFAVALIIQTVFVRTVRLRGGMLGEEMLADLREDFLVRAVGLPPGVLERAGHGRPVVPDHHGHRPARQRDARGRAAAGHRRGVGGAAARRAGRHGPAAGARGADRAAGARSIGLPLVLPAGAVGLPLGGRRVRGGRLRADRDGRRRAARSRRTGSAPAGSRSRTGGSRSGRPGSGTRCSCGSVLFPVVSVTHMIDMASVLTIGGGLRPQGLDDGRASSPRARCYAQMLVEPVGLILRWYDELQVAQVSLGRLVGVREIEPERG